MKGKLAGHVGDHCSLIPGRDCFGDLPGDEIAVSPPSPIVEPLGHSTRQGIMKRRVSNTNNARRTATHITTKYVITTMFHDVLHIFCFVLLFVWCPCMAINVSVQYNGGLLPGIILLPQCYYHRGTRLNAMKRFCICSLRSHLKRFDIFSPDWGMLRRSSSHAFWTSSSLDVPAGVTQEEGHTGFFIHLPSAVRALIFLARRIQPFLSLVDREVEFCVLTI